MKSPKIKQFKLTNDDEVICEVLEWDEPDNSAILMRGALKVIEEQDFDKRIRFFGFRPWMAFTDDPAMLQTLNAAHIIGESTPDDKLLNIYAETITDLKNALTKNPKVDISVNELQDAVSTLTSEELDDYLSERLVDEVYDPKFLQDSADPKIIHFNPGNTKH